MKYLYIYERSGEISGIGSVNNPPISHKRWFVSDQPPSFFEDKKIVNGEVVFKDTAQLDAEYQKKLTDNKQELRRFLDKEIKTVRLKYITDLPGQEAIYTRKKETAVNYLSLDPLPTDLTDFPLLAKEVGITASSAFELAQIWLNLDNLFENVAASLEKIRLEYYQVIEQAISIEELDSIMNDIQTAIKDTGY